MNMLAQAQSVCGTTDGVDEDMVDYINVLRESVLEAYSGIVQVCACLFVVFVCVSGCVRGLATGARSPWFSPVGCLGARASIARHTHFSTRRRQTCRRNTIEVVTRHQ